MGSRERKRAERRKRKARGGRPAAAAENGEPKPDNPIERGYAKAEERNRAAREALVPLQEGERPRVVTIAAVLSALVAASILIGFASGAEVSGERPEFVSVLAPTLLMGLMAWGLWGARYWAVLGFQTVLVFLLGLTALALAVRPLSAVQVLANLLLLAVAGTFFYFMVKAMARIQMPQRLPRD